MKTKQMSLLELSQLLPVVSSTEQEYIIGGFGIMCCSAHQYDSSYVEYCGSNILLPELVVTAPYRGGGYSSGDAWPWYHNNSGNGYSPSYSSSYGGGGYISDIEENNDVWDSRNKVKFVGYDKKDPSGCLRRCQEMIGVTVGSGYLKMVQMVQNDGTGRAGNKTDKYREGMDLLDSQLKNNQPVIVGVDYQSQHGAKINEGITDHFIVIVSSEIIQINGENVRVYQYYDPITSNDNFGTSQSNYLYEKDGKLIGIYKHHPSRPDGLDYTITQIRQYE